MKVLSDLLFEIFAGAAVRYQLPIHSRFATSPSRLEQAADQHADLHGGSGRTKRPFAVRRVLYPSRADGHGALADMERAHTARGCMGSQRRHRRHCVGQGLVGGGGPVLLYVPERMVVGDVFLALSQTPPLWRAASDTGPLRWRARVLCALTRVGLWVDAGLVKLQQEGVRGMRMGGWHGDVCPESREIQWTWALRCRRWGGCGTGFPVF
eukprot:781708-Pleurochrysis_carterae.AAC.1